ncbi:signal peptide peptidase SppA [Candidatus Neomarinimicrobiota bacterium]
MTKNRNRKPYKIWLIIGFIIITIIVFRLGASTGQSSPLSFGDKIGIVTLEGPIFSSRQVIYELNKMADRSDVKAIVFRINSPGGTVAPSQEIYEKIKTLNDRIPIIVSVGNLAASGGYYAALESEKIVANRGSIVGSIGVILDYPVAVELLDKIGLRFETLTSGDLKDAGSPTRPVTDKDRDFFQSVINDLHDQFIKAVSKGRSIEMSEVSKLADGRIFTGEQAIKLGLIDTIGTYEDAIQIAGEIAGIPGKPNTIQLRKESKTIFDFLLGYAKQNIESWKSITPAYRWQWE